MVRELCATKHGSIEGRVFRGSVCAHLPRKKLHNLFRAQNIPMEQDDVINGTNGDARAGFAGEQSDLADVSESSGREEENGAKGIAKSSCNLSRINSDRLLVTGSLKKYERYLCRGSDKQVKFLVTFLFARRNA